MGVFSHFTSGFHSDVYRAIMGNNGFIYASHVAEKNKNITIYGPPRDDFSSNQKALKSGLSFDAWYITIHIISLAMEVT